MKRTDLKQRHHDRAIMEMEQALQHLRASIHKKQRNRLLAQIERLKARAAALDES